MDADELAHVDQQLRAICEEHGLSWVVSDVDGLIHQGHHIADPHESRDQWALDYLGRYQLEISSGKRPPAASLRGAPFSDLDRTLLLLDAMLTVFTDLPAMYSNARSALVAGWNGKAPVTSSIAFLDDTHSQSVHLDEMQIGTYEPVISSLRNLRAEVTRQ